MDRHTLDEDFAHYLSYSGRWRESDEIIDLLHEAFEAAWQPQRRLTLDAFDKVMIVLFVLAFSALIGIIIGIVR